jgi:hypothetical protein
MELQNELLLIPATKLENGPLPQSLLRFIKKHAAALKDNAFREGFTTQSLKLKLGGADTISKVFLASDSLSVVVFTHCRTKRYLNSLSIYLPFPRFTGRTELALAIQSSFKDKTVLLTINTAGTFLSNIDELYLQANPTWRDFGSMWDIHRNALKLLQEKEKVIAISVTDFPSFAYAEECVRAALLRKNQARLHLLRANELSAFSKDALAPQKTEIE